MYATRDEERTAARSSFQIPYENRPPSSGFGILLDMYQQRLSSSSCVYGILSFSLLQSQSQKLLENLNSIPCDITAHSLTQREVMHESLAAQTFLDEIQRFNYDFLHILVSTG